MYLPPSVGLQKTSLNDYPGKIASVIFFPGCNMRCPYCHNPDLVLGKTEGLVSRDEVIQIVKNRAPLMGGVVISGGEPLLYPGLSSFIKSLKENKNIKIKLDTNGLNPKGLQYLLQSESKPDFIAMDIKTHDQAYRHLTGLKEPDVLIRQSIKLIMDSDVSYQFRSTVHPDFINKENVGMISEMIKGCDSYLLQAFQPGSCFDPDFNKHQAVSEKELLNMQSLFIQEGIACSVRSR